VYSAQDYLANLGTQSGLSRLGEQRRAEFLDRSAGASLPGRS
jgi:hypothetical protein